MPLPTPVPVSVNFNVVIDADSKLQLFGEQAPAPTNVIVAEHTLPVTALYDAQNEEGLIEIWEPMGAQGDIKCQLANSNTTSSGGPMLVGAYQSSAKHLAHGLEAILCDSFDCSGAAPYSNYTDYEEYYKQRDFGRVALGMMSHYLFGHVDATAAITNDKDFVESMLSVNAAGDEESTGGAAMRAAAYTKSTSANVEAWDFASSSGDANLALRLVKAIVEKGKLGGDVTSTTLVQPVVSDVTDTVTDATLANIVKQVIGQDSSRTQSVDGSERTREQHLLLRFYVGDVIYINIKVKKPTVEVTGYGAGANAPANTLVTEQSYAIKITLAEPVAEGPDFVVKYAALSASADGNLYGRLVIETNEANSPTNPPLHVLYNGVGKYVSISPIYRDWRSGKACYRSTPSGLPMSAIGQTIQIGRNGKYQTVKVMAAPAFNTLFAYDGIYYFRNANNTYTMRLDYSSAFMPELSYLQLKNMTTGELFPPPSLDTTNHNLEWLVQAEPSPYSYANVLYTPTTAMAWANAPTFPYRDFADAFPFAYEDTTKTKLLGVAITVTISSLVIPNGVTIVGENAFTGATDITEVIFPSGLLTIEAYAFDSCINLVSVTIPSSVESIGEGAFIGTALASVTVPAGCTVEPMAFPDECTVIFA